MPQHPSIEQTVGSHAEDSMYRPLRTDDDAAMHSGSSHPEWREAWCFVFFDQATQVHGIANLCAYPSQQRVALWFGVWEGDRGLHMVRKLDVPMQPGQDPRLVEPLSVRCIAPNERWHIAFDDGVAKVDIEWRALSPIYDWEWTQLTGSRHYEQTGAVTGLIEVAGRRLTVNGFSQRDRSWGPRSFAVVQQCWTSQVQFSADFYSHQSIVTVAGRDYLFGYLMKDGDLQRIASLYLNIGFAHTWGPPSLTRAKLVDAAGRSITYMVEPVNVISATLAGPVDRVYLHTTFSRFSLGDRSAIGHVDYWFSSPHLVRSHQVVRDGSMGRMYHLKSAAAHSSGGPAEPAQPPA